MKQFFTVLTIMFFAFGYAQETKTDKQKIEDISIEIYQASIDLDFEKIVNLTYPKTFDFASKEQMIELFKTVFSGNGDMKIEIDSEMPQFSYSEIFSNENQKFAFISYDMKMKMTFLKQSFDDSMQEMMVSTMKQQGAEAVFIDDSTLNLKKANTVMVAIDDELTNGWTIVNFNENDPLTSSLLSEDIIEKALIYLSEIETEE